MWKTEVAINIIENRNGGGGAGGEGQKGSSTSFFPVTSTIVGISPQNFLTFSFNLLSTLVQKF